MTKVCKNIGIVAHVDAGKTTLTEQLLFASGATRKVGSVDDGTTATDSLTVERERGISVRLATETFYWNDHQINLIDTPGHVDFSAEVERSLRALDCAILVVSSVEGVQANTSSIFDALQYLNIPTLIFINKLDRAGADVERVMAEIHQNLSPNAVLLQQPSNLGQTNAGISDSWFKANCPSQFTSEELEPWLQPLLERLTELDDELLEAIIESVPVTFEEVDQKLSHAISCNEIYPVFTGVAKAGIGINELLNAIIHYLPNAKQNNNAALSAIVFKIEHDQRIGKMAYVRVFEGTLNARDKIHNATRSHEAYVIEDKASQVKRVIRGKYQDMDCIEAGDIGVVSGLQSAKIGDILGLGDAVPDAYQLSAPLLTVQVIPDNEKDFSALASALTELADEDPLLNLEWLVEQRELHVNINGWIQVEVLQAILQQRFAIQATFKQPSIIYKETPTQPVEGYECYWMPKPCWAIVRFLIEPAQRGSGVHYESKVSVNQIAAKYQNEIQANLAKALKQGIKGWSITDVKITLIDGSDHVQHSRPGDFIIATPMAIMNGLNESDTDLLEPILDFQIQADSELLGTLTSDITKMRGHFDAPEFQGNRVIIRGKFPAATSLDYAIKLASLSGGHAKMSTRLSGYEICSPEQGQTTAYRGISPLDRDKYILWARGALQ
ncbi:GTP-binding protein [Marinomonas gallaica]|uniref:GTP-binding protein n=1 Tax=Marinomonas gallaica TaxID=1806667 RepID=UPI000B214A0F|nr:TetM/TetW/TetO/TetS family tetracycline resistance ribosomal protection protein [Marinomonas gallaica]